MPNGMGKPVQQFMIGVSITGEKWMRWSRLYDFTAGQFKKGIEAIVILINFPFLEGFKLWLVLDNLFPNPVYRITFLKMTWKVI